jgi:hypothetical protein
MGWRRLIVGGQSRGARNVPQMLDTPGLADAVIAISPAAHGEGGSRLMSSQTDELRRIDRPPGFSGHGAGGDPHFAELYGPALLDLVEPAGSFRGLLRGKP